MIVTVTFECSDTGGKKFYSTHANSHLEKPPLPWKGLSTLLKIKQKGPRILQDSEQKSRVHLEVQLF